MKMVQARRWLAVAVTVNVFVFYAMYTYLVRSFQEKIRLLPAPKAIGNIQHTSKYVAAEKPEISKSYNSKDSFLKQSNHPLEVTQYESEANNDTVSISQNSNIDVHLAVLEAEVHRAELLKQLTQTHGDHCHVACRMNDSTTKQQNYPFFLPSFQINPDLLSSLGAQTRSPKQFCDGKLNIFYHSFALLKDVILNPDRRGNLQHSVAGKELYKFTDVSLRTDEDEILRPKSGLLQLHCNSREKISIDNKTAENTSLLKHLWIHNNRRTSSRESSGITIGYHHQKQFTLAIERQEYANLYHMMLHMHNMFIMLMNFHHGPLNTSILVLDGHPKAEVDNLLETLYGPIIRLSKLKSSIRYDNLVLSLKESKSPLSKYWKTSLPHLEEFKHFMLQQHMISDTHTLNCKRLTVTFIWRRDKVWHPRNLPGMVHRKIFNEGEIFKAIYEKYPSVCVNGLLLETMPMKEQLKYIVNTDILIGMHGAGLTHALFLPKTAGLIELFPMNFRKQFQHHGLFQAIARWRHLKYLFWENTDKDFELRYYYTKVDHQALVKLVDNMIRQICVHEF